MSESDENIAAAAREGNDDALERIRSALGTDPSRQNPHVFEVSPNSVLHDTLRLGPQRREQVFGPFPKFVPENAMPLMHDTRRAMEAVRDCPPLAKAFDLQALSMMGDIETRLVTDESLSRAERGRLDRNFVQLGAPGRAYWENWVSETPAAAHRQFDVLTQRWLREPIDESESQWFRTSWRDHNYSVESATHFFTRMPEVVRQFLGVGLGVAPASKMEVAFLVRSIAEANRQAKRLKVKFRFKSR